MMPVLVCAVLAWTSLRLPETLPKTRRQTLHPRALWVNHSQVRRTYDFLLLSAIPTRNFAAIFIYVAAVPTYPLDLLGVSTYGSAWLFIPRITRIMTGVVLSGQLAGRLSPQLPIRLGYACVFAGAFSTALLLCSFRRVCLGPCCRCSYSRWEPAS